jgi:hypothetical protein
MQKRVLVYHPRMFGDIIIGTAAAKALKEKYPECHITYITGCKALTETNPFINKSFEINLPKRLESLFFKLVKLFYSESYFLLHWLPEDNIVQSLMTSIGLEKKNYPLQLYLEENDNLIAESYLKKLKLDHKHTIAIQADFGRKWNDGEFERLKLTLSEKYNLVLIGEGMLAHGKKLSFREAAAVIGKCDLYVGGISGTMHAAVAVGVPTISTPNVFNAEWDMPEFTQNEFVTDPLKRHITVVARKELFCGNYAGVHNNGKYVYVDGDNYSPQVCFTEINRGQLGNVYSPSPLSLLTPCRCSIKAEDIHSLVEAFFSRFVL